MIKLALFIFITGGFIVLGYIIYEFVLTFRIAPELLLSTVKNTIELLLIATGVFLLLPKQIRALIEVLNASYTNAKLQKDGIFGSWYFNLYKIPDSARVKILALGMILTGMLIWIIF